MDVQTRLEATFLDYLVTQRVIRDADIERVHEQRRQFAAPLGRLAMQRGLLTMRQVTRLLQLQLDEDRQFGELAVAQGLLTAEQLQQLLAMQRQVQPSLGSVIVQMALVDDETMERLTTDFLLSTAHAVC